MKTQLEWVQVWMRGEKLRDDTENYSRDLTTKVNRETGYEEIAYLYVDPNNSNRDRK